VQRRGLPDIRFGKSGGVRQPTSHPTVVFLNLALNVAMFGYVIIYTTQIEHRMTAAEVKIELTAKSCRP